MLKEGILFFRCIEDGAYVFRGLPYAIPPLGKLRFRSAQLQSDLNDCWTGTYVANVTQPCWSYDSQVWTGYRLVDLILYYCITFYD